MIAPRLCAAPRAALRRRCFGFPRDAASRNAPASSHLRPPPPRRPASRDKNAPARRIQIHPRAHAAPRPVPPTRRRAPVRAAARENCPPPSPPARQATAARARNLPRPSPPPHDTPGSNHPRRWLQFGREIESHPSRASAHRAARDRRCFLREYLPPTTRQQSPHTPAPEWRHGALSSLGRAAPSPATLPTSAGAAPCRPRIMHAPSRDRPHYRAATSATHPSAARAHPRQNPTRRPARGCVRR